MNIHRRFAPLAAVGLLTGCANPDSVLFVTDSTIGIDVDKKPPTASIAYDRIEGYIGPRYQNGAVPPVVGSIETGGSVFDPKIRQVYATGAAAVKAVGTTNAPDGPTVLSGDPTQKRLVFFGTTTTLGLKVGFSGDGYPDSLTFGYKRKEFSFIPLGSQVIDGVTTDVYPSILASIDTTTSATSLKGTGLTNKQFFATGQAAETLATNSSVADAFKRISKDTVTAVEKGIEQSREQDVKLMQIKDAIAPNGVLDKTKLASLVNKANAKNPDSVLVDLKNYSTWEEVRKRIENSQPTVLSLFDALSP